MIVINRHQRTRGCLARSKSRRALLIEAIAEPVDQIVLAVRRALENTWSEIAPHIIEGGIAMTGSGSLLPRIETVPAEQMGLSVRIADDPMNCLAVGAGRTLESSAYRGACIRSETIFISQTPDPA